MNSHKRIKAVLTFTAMAMAIVILATGSAMADLVLEEQFIYEPVEANIDGQDGGIGFDSPWIATTSGGRIYWIRSPGLTFSTVPVAGYSLSRLGSMGRAEAHRTFSGPEQTALTADNATVWFSALFQPPSAYKYAAFVFGTDAFTTGGTPVLASDGEGFGFTLTGADGVGTSSTINALVFDDDITPKVTVSSYNPGTATSLIVGKINWKPNGTPDELFLFNITDLNAEPGEGSAIVSITDKDLDQSSFNTVGMWDTNNAIFDEIRFGTTFADVQIAADRSLPTVDAGGNWITWSGEPVTSDTTVINNDPCEPQRDLTYAWTVDAGSLADENLTIEVSDADQEDVTVEVTKALDTGDCTVVTMTLSVTLEDKDPVESSMTIDVCDNSCQAAKATGTVEFDPSDFNADCITNLADIAGMVAEWLENNGLGKSISKNGLVADYDGNYIINLEDFAEMSATWGNGSDAADLLELARTWLDDYTIAPVVE